MIEKVIRRGPEGRPMMRTVNLNRAITDPARAEAGDPGGARADLDPGDNLQLLQVHDGRVGAEEQRPLEPQCRLVVQGVLVPVLHDELRDQDGHDTIHPVGIELRPYVVDQREADVPERGILDLEGVRHPSVERAVKTARPALVDAAGHSLYLFEKDGTGRSTLMATRLRRSPIRRMMSVFHGIASGSSIGLPGGGGLGETLARRST